MAGAGSSQRQKARRSTISTVVLALIRPPAFSRWRTFVPYLCFEEPGPDGAAARHDGRKARNLRGAVPMASTSSALEVAAGGLNCQPNQPLTALR